LVHAITLIPVALAGAAAMLAMGLGSLSDLARTATGADEPRDLER
jgi:hypothetical protein